MKKPAPKEVPLSVRISSDLKRQMEAVSGVGPYRVPVTDIMRRGIELALKELAEIRAGKSK